MGSSLWCSATDDVSVSCIWSRLVVLSMIVTAVVYTLVGLLHCRGLIRRDIRWLFVLVLYFVVGACHAFLTLTFLCVAVALVFYTFGEQVVALEIIVFALIMVIATVFFAYGRKSLLYSM